MRENPHYKAVVRCLQMSLVIVGFMAIVAGAHSFFVHGYIILDNMAYAGIIAGSLMSLVGVLKYFSSVFTGTGRLIDKNDRLLDRSTFVERAQPERVHKKLEGYEYICIGVSTAIFAGFLQMILHLLFN